MNRRTFALDFKVETVKLKTTKDSSHTRPVAPNRLNQNFVAIMPNQVWLSDTTYIWTREGWLYLCCMLDLFNREIVGWAMRERMDAKIGWRTFEPVQSVREPCGARIAHPAWI